MLDNIMWKSMECAKRVLEEHDITDDTKNYYELLQSMTASVFIEHSRTGKHILSPDKIKEEHLEILKECLGNGIINENDILERYGCSVEDMTKKGAVELVNEIREKGCIGG